MRNLQITKPESANLQHEKHIQDLSRYQEQMQKDKTQGRSEVTAELRLGNE